MLDLLLSRQHSLVFASCFAPATSILLVLGQHAHADPHQSPTRGASACATRQDQGWCALGGMLKARPQVRLTDPRKSSVPRRVQLDILHVLWFLTNPIAGSRRGRIRLQKQSLSGSVVGCSRFQSHLVDGKAGSVEKKVLSAMTEEGISPEKTKWYLENLFVNNAEGFIPGTSPFEAVSVTYRHATYPFLFWNTDAIILYFLWTFIFGLVFKPIIKVNI